MDNYIVEVMRGGVDFWTGSALIGFGDNVLCYVEVVLVFAVMLGGFLFLFYEHFIYALF